MSVADFVGRRRGALFHVMPRYTAGSPSVVDEATAQRVACEEALAYERALRGRYGAEAAQRASALGLAGIAECRVPAGSSMRTYDLITNEVGQKSQR